MRMMGNMTRKRVILMPRMERELRIMRTTTMITRTDAKHTIVVPNIFPYTISCRLQALQCLLRHLHSLKPHLE